MFHSKTKRPVQGRTDPVLQGHPSAHLSKHFLIVEKEQRLPDGWRGTECLGWWIGRGENLPAHPIRRQDGALCGIMLGWIIGANGLLPDGAPIDGPEGGQDIAEWSADLSGSFICLIGGTEGRAQILLDAGGTLGTVYDPERRAIASIPALIPGGWERDEALIADFGVPTQRGWYPFGLTPAKGVERLLPNFALDLDDFSTRRIWPIEPGAIPDVRPADAILQIYTLVTNIARALGTHGKLMSHLTAGYDSRMVLAALGPSFVNRVVVATIALPNSNTALDVRVAGRLAAQFGLRHEIRTFLPDTAEGIAAWHARTGECIADTVSGFSRTLASWDPDELQLTGGCGELLRAFYWHAADIGGPSPDAAELLKRLNMPHTERMLSAAEDWLSSLPADTVRADAVRVWDLAYLEQRLGCWAGPSIYGSPQPFPSFTPFNNRRIYTAMLGLPDRYRLNAQSCRDFIAEGWPELNRIPFNSPVGLDRLRFMRAQLRSIVPRSLHKPIRRMLTSTRMSA